MQARSLANALLLSFLFYQNVVRPRRWGYFAVRCLVLLVMFFPSFALVGDYFTSAAISTHNVKIKEEVSMVVLMSTIIIVSPWVLSFRHDRPWPLLLLHFISMFIMQACTMVAILEWQFGGLEWEHITFLMEHSPRIVLRYIGRIPREGPGNLWWFLGLLNSVAQKSVFGDPQRRVPKLPVVAPNGSVIYNLTLGEM